MNINKKIIDLTIKNKKEELEKKSKNLNKMKWCKYEMIDVHIHIADFKQETEGLKKLLYYMDKTNVKKAVIFWMPVTKIWTEEERDRPEYYLDDDNSCYYYWNTDNIVAREYLSLTKEEQKRFIPLLCWFNALDINCVQHIKETFNMFPWVFRWIWEVFYRHDDLTNLTYGEAPRMNSKAWLELLKFVSEYDIPLMIHNNITSPWVLDYPKYLHEMETALREYPRAKVILAHCWVSRRLNAPYYVKMIDRLLNEYPNLYVDYSWVVFDDIIAINNQSIKEWLELTEKFSTRIMIWSDILWNGFHKIWYINNKFNNFLDQLTKETRENICINNAEELFKNTKNKVEKNKKVRLPILSGIKI